MKFEKIRKSDYPLSFDFIENRLEQADRIIWKIKPHKGGFIGNCILESDIDCENSQEVFDGLKLGEKFEVCKNDGAMLKPLEVKTKDGVSLGHLPLVNSILPNSLMSRGLDCFCFLEAKSSKAAILSLAVSVYCEDY